MNIINQRACADGCEALSHSTSPDQGSVPGKPDGYVLSSYSFTHWACSSLHQSDTRAKATSLSITCVISGVFGEISARGRAVHGHPLKNLRPTSLWSSGVFGEISARGRAVH